MRGVAAKGAVRATFGEIGGQVTRVATVMTEIAAAVDQQADGVRHVNAGAAQINRVTQQNAANAQQSAATAEELTGQAAALSGLLGGFRLEERPGRAPDARAFGGQRAVASIAFRAERRRTAHGQN